MGKVKTIVVIQDHDSGGSALTNTPSKMVVKSNFNHVSKGAFADTQRALEAYLVGLGIPRQSYTAELIMFMERSFAGKYRSGIRSHYQRIMPSKDWVKGDSLSEKLTRCKDKETFKSRFDRVGTTAILRGGHFDNFDIRNLDFKGKPYLRLIDTNRGNVSYFFRNDAEVDALIAKAISFNQEALRNRKNKYRRTLNGNAGVVGDRKAEVVYLENPKSLLYSEIETKILSKNSNGTPLTLVHSSSSEKIQEQPREGVMRVEDSDVRIDIQQIRQECGEHALIAAAASNAIEPLTVTPNRLYSGSEVVRLWRNSVVRNDSQQCITSNPPIALVKQAAEFAKRFREFFPTEPITNLFEHLAESWKTAQKSFKEAGVWQLYGPYPEIPQLLKHSDHILTWYRREIAATGGLGREEIVQKACFTEAPSNTATTGSIQHSGSHKKISPGRTFLGNESESLEYQIAYGKRYDLMSTDCVYDSLANVCHGHLKRLALDMAKSMARIDELRAMPLDEFEGCCC